MFTWLKTILKKFESPTLEENISMMQTSKGQDQSMLAPYKVEQSDLSTKPHVSEKTKEIKKSIPKQVNRTAPQKKKAVTTGKPAGTRGRKPKPKI